MIIYKLPQNAAWLCLSPTAEGEFGPQESWITNQPLQTYCRAVHVVQSTPIHIPTIHADPGASFPTYTPGQTISAHPDSLHPLSIKPQIIKHLLYLGLYIPSSQSPSLFTSQPSSKMKPSPDLHPSTWRENWEMERNLALFLQKKFTKSSKTVPTNPIYVTATGNTRWDTTEDRSLVEGLADRPTSHLQGHS